MKINKEELKTIAGQLKIDLHDDELDKINDAIYKITDKLNEIFEEDTEGYERTRTMANKEHDITKAELTNKEQVDMKTINNFDGEYVVIQKEQDEE